MNNKTTINMTKDGELFRVEEFPSVAPRPLSVCISLVYTIFYPTHVYTCIINYKYNYIHI